MEIIYYWYHHGDEEFEKRMMEIFEDKDYKAFMEIYKEEVNKRLPEYAVLYVGDNLHFNLPVAIEDVFDNLTYTESEWG